MNKRGSVWQTVKALFLPEGMEQVAKRMRERQKSNQQTKASHISRRSLLFPGWVCQGDQCQYTSAAPGEEDTHVIHDGWDVCERRWWR